ncbi:MAG TPA: M1 family metallopeptidase [Parasegetibacter sp.]
MKAVLLIGVLLLTSVFSPAQVIPPDHPDPEKQYQASAPMINDLVHTRLDARFDYKNQYLIGKVWITLKPHIYATDSVELDAKGMDIKEVALMKGSSKVPLKYNYDGLILRIKLDKVYKGGEQYQVYIDYVAKPNEFNAVGSSAITNAKGLYFINPDGTDKEKPVQIWTQGETESTSVWCPTIDKPNQKTTQEIIMTVPDRFVTLSNGTLASQKKNADGTRTDTWKMDLPHAPYLFFMGVGEYAVIKDSYKGKEVSYYVEKEYASVARKIFGNTPEMLEFFSKILNVEYPWNKYAQIVGRDYVSGAMENTTATLHQESAQQNARELTDGNHWEATIAHEVFHHWFGNLVTTESWSNLTVNESFANYSEYLWLEHKFGKDRAEEHNYEDKEGYILGGNELKDLVRFHYRDKEDMFDAVSYNKGGRILHMLRNYMGDEAFFKGMSLYLTSNKFKAAEAHHFRLAMEEVTGLDLNWFFNQWFFGSGHPKISIDYLYNQDEKKVKVFISQTQDSKIFQFPLAIDIYNGTKVTRHKVWVTEKTSTFEFSYDQLPDLINVDADKVLLAEKKDNKNSAAFLHQYKYGKNYLDRREAIDHFVETNNFEGLQLALKDKYEGLRRYTLESILENKTLIAAIEQDILEMVNKEKNRPAKAAGLEALAVLNKSDYLELFKKNLNDSSYSVAGAALKGVLGLDLELAKNEAKKQSKDAKGKLSAVISDIFIRYGTQEDADFVISSYAKMPANQQKFDLSPRFCDYLANVNDTEQFRKGVDAVVEFRNAIPQSVAIIKTMLNGYLRTVISKKEKLKATDTSGNIQAQIDYINNKIKK